MHDNMVVEPYGSRTLDRSRFGVKRFMGGGSFPEFLFPSNLMERVFSLKDYLEKIQHNR